MPENESALLLLLLLSLVIFTDQSTQGAQGDHVVHEILACCHHHIRLRCPAGKVPDSENIIDPNDQGHGQRIAIISARYVLEKGERTRDFHQDLHSSKRDSNAISLWDMDVKFAPQFTRAHQHGQDFPDLNTPDWMRIDNEAYVFTANNGFKLQSKYKAQNPPISLQDAILGGKAGLNFTTRRQLHLPGPLNDSEFINKESIWKEPLFKLAPNSLKEKGEPLKSPCTSYSTLNYGPDRQIGVRRKKSGLGVGGSPPEWKTQFPKKPQWDYKDLRSVFNHRCSGRSSCDVNLLWNTQKDQDLTRVCHKWPDGKILVRFLCYDLVGDKCSQNLTESNEGFIANPGFPEFYPGDSSCLTRITVQEGQKILLLFLDISLRGEEKSSRCVDHLSVEDGGRKLLSTCGDHSSAISVLSLSNSLNISLEPQSRMAYPKRGFLAYFRVLGCQTPAPPRDSHLIFRNATHAHLSCELGHVFPDILRRDRWIICETIQHRWTPPLLDCQDIRNLEGKNSTIADLLSENPELWPIVDRGTSRVLVKIKTSIARAVTGVFLTYILPILIILLLLTIHGFVYCYIKGRLNRQEEFENEENQEMEEQAHREQLYAKLEGGGADMSEGSTFSFTSSTGDFYWDAITKEPSPPNLNDVVFDESDDEGGFLLGGEGSPKTVALSTKLSGNSGLPSPEDDFVLTFQLPIPPPTYMQPPPVPPRRSLGLLPLKITSV